MQLLFATNNQGKLAEVKAMLEHTGLEVLSLTEAEDLLHKDLVSIEVEETGQTFAENALIKAKVYAHETGFLTAADDSGLEVQALDNFPGIVSARWQAGNDIDRNRALLKKMEVVEDRTAKFVAVICLYDPQVKAYKNFQGEVKGKIAKESRGEAGFGYDPIFIPEGYDQSFAELGIQIKNKISHRYQALKKMKTYFDRDQATVMPTSK
jgi:XTP/dITP diphosphohydrolase